MSTSGEEGATTFLARIAHAPAVSLISIVRERSATVSRADLLRRFAYRTTAAAATIHASTLAQRWAARACGSASTSRLEHVEWASGIAAGASTVAFGSLAIHRAGSRPILAIGFLMVPAVYMTLATRERLVLLRASQPALYEAVGSVAVGAAPLLFVPASLRALLVAPLVVPPLCARWLADAVECRAEADAPAVTDMAAATALWGWRALAALASAEPPGAHEVGPAAPSAAVTPRALDLGTSHLDASLLGPSQLGTSASHALSSAPPARASALPAPPAPPVLSQAEASRCELPRCEVLSYAEATSAEAAGFTAHTLAEAIPTHSAPTSAAGSSQYEHLHAPGSSQHDHSLPGALAAVATTEDFEAARKAAKKAAKRAARETARQTVRAAQATQVVVRAAAAASGGRSPHALFRAVRGPPPAEHLHAAGSSQHEHLDAAGSSQHEHLHAAGSSQHEHLDAAGSSQHEHLHAGIHGPSPPAVLRTASSLAVFEIRQLRQPSTSTAEMIAERISKDGQLAAEAMDLADLADLASPRADVVTAVDASSWARPSSCTAWLPAAASSAASSALDVAAQVGGWLAGWLTLPLTLPLAVLYSDALHAQVHRGARGAAQGLASFSVATGWLSDAQCVIGSEGL